MTYIYTKVSPNSRVHIVREENISTEYSHKGYVFPICGLTSGPLITATREDFDNNYCKGCKQALLRRAVAKMKYGR